MITAAIFVVLAFVIITLVFILIGCFTNFQKLKKELDTVVKVAWRKNEELSQLRQKYEALQRTLALDVLPPGVITAAQVQTCKTCGGLMKHVAVLESLGGVNPDIQVWECPACNPQLPFKDRETRF